MRCPGPRRRYCAYGIALGSRVGSPRRELRRWLSILSSSPGPLLERLCARDAPALAPPSRVATRERMHLRQDTKPRVNQGLRAWSSRSRTPYGVASGSALSAGAYRPTSAANRAPAWDLRRKLPPCIICGLWTGADPRGCRVSRETPAPFAMWISQPRAQRVGVLGRIGFLGFGGGRLSRVRRQIRQARIAQVTRGGWCALGYGRVAHTGGYTRRRRCRSCERAWITTSDLCFSAASNRQCRGATFAFCWRLRNLPLHCDAGGIAAGVEKKVDKLGGQLSRSGWPQLPVTRPVTHCGGPMHCKFDLLRSPATSTCGLSHRIGSVEKSVDNSGGQEQRSDPPDRYYWSVNAGADLSARTNLTST